MIRKTKNKGIANYNGKISANLFEVAAVLSMYRDGP